MFYSSLAAWLVAVPAFLGGWAVAQTSTGSPSSPPHTVAPVLSFHSVLDGYRSFSDDKAAPWKEANDTVYRRGGWRAYAREAEGSGNSDSSPDVDPHAGHPRHPHAKEQP